eukprot:scaffold151739_cov54-Attheya_sp.AAC.1
MESFYTLLRRGVTVLYALDLCSNERPNATPANKRKRHGGAARWRIWAINGVLFMGMLVLAEHYFPKHAHTMMDVSLRLDTWEKYSTGKLKKQAASQDSALLDVLPGPSLSERIGTKWIQDPQITKAKKMARRLRRRGFHKKDESFLKIMWHSKHSDTSP